MKRNVTTVRNILAKSKFVETPRSVLYVIFFYLLPWLDCWQLILYIIQCKILYSIVFYRSDQGDRKGQTQTARWSEASSKVRRRSETFLWYGRRVSSWKRRKLLSLGFTLWSDNHSLLFLTSLLIFLLISIRVIMETLFVFLNVQL